MKLKTIVAAALALIVGYIVIKILWWMVGVAFTIAITVFQIVLVLLIAVPVTLVLRKMLFK